MIPSKVKVGGLFYNIIVSDELLVLDSRQCRGTIDYQKQIIKLAGDSVQSEQGRMQTLFHELVHALRHSRGLDWGDNDELYTDEIGIAMHALFVDNDIRFIGSMNELENEAVAAESRKDAAQFKPAASEVKE